MGDVIDARSRVFARSRRARAVQFDVSRAPIRTLAEKTMTCAMWDEGSTLPHLESRYELGEAIGEGAAARVHEARDLTLGIDVAVKMLHHEHWSSSAVRDAFAREAELTERMMSPHIVRMLGVAISRLAAPCIVYERLVGETLEARLERQKTLSLAETSEIVTQTSRALARAHALGIVHRDVRPANVFLVAQPGGRVLVKLIDFGIAEIAGANGGASTNAGLFGAPQYMAPELVFNTHHASARTDLYSLAVVAFECLTGRLPFPAERMEQIIALLERGARPSVQELRPELHAEIDAWMDCALDPDPLGRFATAKDLSDALQGAALAARRIRPQANASGRRSPLSPKTSYTAASSRTYSFADPDSTS